MDIKTILTSITPIEEIAWNDFEQYFSKKTLKKHEVLWKSGDICKYLIFINHGLLYSYFNKDGEEIINKIYFDNSIFTDDYSFISQESCMLNYVALEETELLVIPRVGLYNMYDKYKSFERLGRMMLEQIHVSIINEQVKFNGLKSEEKYSNFIAGHPDILQRVPLKIIASYLNITPEHLSRIRKKLFLS